jgi:Flp pilus assembly protein TadG
VACPAQYFRWAGVVLCACSRPLMGSRIAAVTDSRGDIPRTTGQSLVELALILPVFLIIVLGSIDIGRGFIFGVAVQDGARESTRVAANARVDPGVTDAFIVQRVIDAASPAMLGCVGPATVTSTPVTFSCGGGDWTITMAVRPSGSATSYSAFSAVPSSALAQLNGGTIEIKTVGSVSLLSGFATGWRGLSLYQITVQGDAVMVIL